MDLKQLVVDSKAMWIDFAGLDGFSIEIANLSRKELNSIRKKCTTSKFNRKTRQIEEILDDDKFVKEFTKGTIKNWKGLSLEHLETLLLIDAGDKDKSEEVAYSRENAEILVGQSTEFDTWLNEVVFDLENFRDRPKTEVPRKTGGAVQKS
tara:strand:- start:13458 stop:13910 length:453 start_codon:yes stop_codon:yes gene_type:complete